MKISVIIFLSFFISTVSGQDLIFDEFQFAGETISLSETDRCAFDPKENAVVHCHGFSILFQYAHNESELQKEFDKQIALFTSVNRPERTQDIEMYSFGCLLKGKEIEIILSDTPSYFGYILKGKINDYFVVLQLHSYNPIKMEKDLGVFASKFVSLKK